MERVASQEELVRTLWGVGQADAVNAPMPFIQRVPSLNTLLGQAPPAENHHQQQQHLDRVQSMEFLRKYLGSSGDLSQLNTMQAQAVAVQAVAQATVQQAVVAQQ